MRISLLPVWTIVMKLVTGVWKLLRDWCLVIWRYLRMLNRILSIKCHFLIERNLIWTFGELSREIEFRVTQVPCMPRPCGVAALSAGHRISRRHSASWTWRVHTSKTIMGECCRISRDEVSFALTLLAYTASVAFARGGLTRWDTEEQGYESGLNSKLLRRVSRRHKFISKQFDGQPQQHPPPIQPHSLPRCLREGKCQCNSPWHWFLQDRADIPHSRGGASGNKLKMTLGLPVYATTLYSPLVIPCTWCHYRSISNDIFSQRRRHELLRQFWRAKSLHHLCQGLRRSSKPLTCRRCWRHGHGNSQEREARTEEKGYAGCGGQTKQTMEESRWGIPVFWGQRWRGESISWPTSLRTALYLYTQSEELGNVGKRGDTFRWGTSWHRSILLLTIFVADCQSKRRNERISYYRPCR